MGFKAGAQVSKVSGLARSPQSRAEKVNHRPGAAVAKSKVRSGWLGALAP
jgi:hypothetical protein